MVKKKEKTPEQIEADDKFAAAVRLLGHTGAEQFQLRWSDEDKPPVSFTAVARWGNRWECAGAMNPLLAAFRLCDQVIDGGQCTHCKKPTGFISDDGDTIMNQFVCWFQWDPSTKKFMRGCD